MWGGKGEVWTSGWRTIVTAQSLRSSSGGCENMHSFTTVDWVLKGPAVESEEDGPFHDRRRFAGRRPQICGWFWDLRGPSGFR